MAAIAFEIQHGVHHVLDHLRPSDLAVFGDVTDKQQRAARSLGVADESLCGGADLAHGTGCGLDCLGPKRLDRVDDDEVGRLSMLERCEDARKACLARKLDGCIGEA